MSETPDLEWVIKSWEDRYGEELRLAEDECGELVLEGRFCGTTTELLRLLADIIREVIDNACL